MYHTWIVYVHVYINTKYLIHKINVYNYLANFGEHLERTL